jgi:tetratricopeptide (TPR) repeat protein
VQRDKADANAKEAKEQTKVAVQTTERQRQTADEAIKNMVEVFNRLDSRLQSKRLPIRGTPEVRRLRADLLADLKEALAKVGRKLQRSAADTFVEAAAAQLIGDTLMRFGQVKEAREAFRAGHDSVKKRVELEPESDKARANLGQMELRLGHAAMELEGDALTALAHYREARRLHDEIRTTPRSGEYTDIKIKQLISHDDIHLATALLALGEPTEARKFLLESSAFREEWRASEPNVESGESRSYIMQAEMFLGVAAWHLGDEAGAKTCFARAVGIAEELIKELKDTLPYKADLAEALGYQGDSLIRFGKFADAEKAYTASMANLKAFLAANPDDVEHQPLMALTVERLGTVYALLGRPAEAKKQYEEAMQLRGELFQVDPDNRSRRMAYLVAAARAGKVGDATKYTAKFRPDMVKSKHLMLQVARVFAICAAGDAANKEQWTKEAMAALAVATKGDYQAAAALRTDPDLAALRGGEAFEKLVAEVAKR